MAVGAALPTAARDLHGLGAYGWAFTGFLVANIVGIVASGQLSDTRGPRPALVAGLAAFLVGLVLSGTATTMAMFVVGRVVQGLGGGLIITAVYVVIGQSYTEALRPPLFAAISSAWVVPSLVGPVASGVLTQHASWRYVFLGLVPFTVLGGALLVPVLRDMHRRTDGSAGDRLRLVRAGALALGVAAVEQAGQHPSAATLGTALAGIVVAGWALRRLLPAGTFAVRRGVSAPVAMRGLLAGALFGVEAAVPLSLTVQHGYRATAAGLPLAIAGVTWAFGSWLQKQVDEQRRPGVRIVFIRSGFACVAVAAAGMAISALPASPGWIAFPAWMCGGLGAGLTMTNVGVLLLRFTTDTDRGADSAALQVSDATASALTTGLAGVLIAAAARSAISFTTAFVLLDATMVGVALIGVAVAGRARAADAPEPSPMPTPAPSP